MKLFFSQSSLACSRLWKVQPEPDPAYMTDRFDKNLLAERGPYLRAGRARESQGIWPKTLYSGSRANGFTQCRSIRDPSLLTTVVGIRCAPRPALFPEPESRLPPSPASHREPCQSRSLAQSAGIPQDSLRNAPLISHVRHAGRHHRLRLMGLGRFYHKLSAIRRSRRA